MKGILGLLQQTEQIEVSAGSPEAHLFGTGSGGSGPATQVPWPARAMEVDASKLDPQRGGKLLQALWAKDKQMCQLDLDAIGRLEPFVDYCSVAANRELIRQDEHGDFMLVLLSGGIAVDRQQPWGERLRLSEVVPGEILGEMSLLDGGVRFSSCTTLTDCDIAVLSASALQDMLKTDPALAANLVTLLARKLTLRLRSVSARLSDKK